MKKITLAVTFLALMVSVTAANAQSLSKKERKAIKKEIRTYKKDPEKWVMLKKNHEIRVVELEKELAYLKAKLAAANAEKQELANKLSALMTQYTALKASVPSTKLPMGTVYQVQMGYYQYLDLLSFNEKLKTIKAESVDGKKRYVIGHFDDLMDAVQFRNDIKSLGIDDAFVSQYKDGERVMGFDAMKAIDQ
ncbi:hypothetical protein N9J89_00565 [Bacteroidia bacterium]|nr:hypothetical protein [Bacteroidia bacterium]